MQGSLGSSGMGLPRPRAGAHGEAIYLGASSSGEDERPVHGDDSGNDGMVGNAFGDVSERGRGRDGHVSFRGETLLSIGDVLGQFGSVDSSAKDKLSGWWLQLVEDSVEQWLVDAHPDRYTPHDDCVPEQYLDVAPRDLTLVKRNYDVIQEVLKERGSGCDVHLHLMRPLADTIYGKISELERVLRLLLLHFSDNLDEKAQDHHRSDLKYLDRMRTLEAEFEAKFFGDDPRRRKGDVDDTKPSEKRDTGGSISDIVPVSGLAWGKIHRLDNELRTVIGHWEGRIRR